jgi:hypothetical protein
VKTPKKEGIMPEETRNAEDLKVSDEIYRDGYRYTISHIEPDNSQETIVLWFTNPRHLEGNWPEMKFMRTHVKRPFTLYV